MKGLPVNADAPALQELANAADAAIAAAIIELHHVAQQIDPGLSGHALKRRVHGALRHLESASDAVLQVSRHSATAQPSRVEAEAAEIRATIDKLLERAGREPIPVTGERARELITQVLERRRGSLAP
jgi:hypothetical protein